MRSLCLAEEDLHLLLEAMLAPESMLIEVEHHRRGYPPTRREGADEQPLLRRHFRVRSRANATNDVLPVSKAGASTPPTVTTPSLQVGREE